MQRTLERSSLDVNIGYQTFTGLNYADDVALLAEMPRVLVARLGALSEEASQSQLGLQVNSGLKPKSCVLEAQTQFHSL